MMREFPGKEGRIAMRARPGGFVLYVELGGVPPGRGTRGDGRATARLDLGAISDRLGAQTWYRPLKANKQPCFRMREIETVDLPNPQGDPGRRAEARTSKQSKQARLTPKGEFEWSLLFFMFKRAHPTPPIPCYKCTPVCGIP